MTSTEAFVALNMVPEVGSVRLRNLRAAFGCVQEILDASFEELCRVPGIAQGIASKIRNIAYDQVSQEMEMAHRCGVSIVTVDDEGYPGHLRAIPGPPNVLYVRGAFTRADVQAVSVVGSRCASLYGLMNAERFAAGFVRSGFTVVSGMARGIDTYAHRGALRAQGRTIAVLGSGLGHIYPAENKELADAIAGSGAVVSEFPMLTPPLKQNFPRRNRVISGLSRGVLVVEAARNSGAIITADFALEQGREVFAIPGKIDSDTSSGTNELIKQGAVVALSVEDVLNELEGEPASLPATREDSGIQDGVLRYLSSDPMALDELAARTRQDIPGLVHQLVTLQLRQLVRQLPGNLFVRSNA